MTLDACTECHLFIVMLSCRYAVCRSADSRGAIFSIHCLAWLVF
jgi:hypothetical protein